MRVLVACEVSGIVRDAFIRRGHDAVSCDLLPTESPGPHIQGDVRPLLRRYWDLVIAHPPCNDLSVAGQCRPFTTERQLAMFYAAHFFNLCLNANAPRVAVENPIPRLAAREFIGTPDQYIEPWHYGHPYQKRTGLWLRGLPPLLAMVAGVPNVVSWVSGGKVGVNGRRPTTNIRSAKKRAQTFEGVAEAMAAQWG